MGGGKERRMGGGEKREEGKKNGRERRMEEGKEKKGREMRGKEENGRERREEEWEKEKKGEWKGEEEKLSLEDHLAAVARRAFYQVRLVYQLRPYLDRDDLRTVTHAMVTSRLDYCNALYMGLPLKSTRRLQLVQNAAARTIMGATRRSHVSPLLRDLHWLPVVYRVRFKVLVMTFKALHGIGPGYLRDRLLPASRRPVRSHREGLLGVPSASQCRLATPRGRAFSVGAPSLWNELPTSLRTIPDLRTFRVALKTWLFQQAGLA